MRYEDMEYENYCNVLRAIEYDLENPSRAEVAKFLGLSRTAVSLISNNLIAAGLVSETKKTGAAVRGRPGSPLCINNSRWKLLGASLHVSTWQFVICNLGGEILDTLSMDVDPLTPDTLIDVLIAGAEKMVGKHASEIIPGIGIGVPGVVDSSNGRIIFASDQKWFSPIDIERRVEEALKIKAYVMNRYTLSGLAEYKYANPDKEKNMIYIGVGSGIRSAIFARGELLQGANFGAGRISHIQVNPTGNRCSCGRIGCLITEANEAAIVRKALCNLDAMTEPSALRDMPSDRITAYDVLRAAKEGDRAAVASIESAAAALAKVILMLLDVIDPGRIVIGGPVGESDLIVDAVNRCLEASEKGDVTPLTSISVERAKIMELSSSEGAAALVSMHKLELLRDIVLG